MDQLMYIVVVTLFWRCDAVIVQNNNGHSSFIVSSYV